MEGGNGQITIQIENAKIEDTAMYSLRIDKHETKCKVIVEQLKKQISAPKIIKDLDTKPLEFLTSEPFSMSLHVTGNDLLVDWFRDGEIIYIVNLYVWHV